MQLVVFGRLLVGLGVASHVCGAAGRGL